MSYRVGVIGAGKVGCAIGRFLAAMGCAPAGFASRSRASAEAACALLGGAVYETAALPEVCNVIFLTTPDDALPETAALLRQAGSVRHGTVFLHMSGATPSAVLRPLYTGGGGIFSLHPIYSFSDKNVAPDELANVCFTAEGSGDDRFVRRYFPKAVWISPSQKAAYHAALCMMSNDLVTLMGEAQRIIEPLGIGMEACRPLIEKTLENVLCNGAGRALTGPIARGDAGTVAAHLRALAPDNRFYREMARFTADFARQSGQCSAEAYQKIMEVLHDGKDYDA